MKSLLATLWLLLFYVVPWSPFIFAAFWVHGWPKLALCAVGILGPIVQAIVIARAFDSD